MFERITGMCVRGLGLAALGAMAASAAVFAVVLMLSGLLGAWDEDPGLVRAFCVFGVGTTEEGCPRPAPPPLVKGAVLEQGMAVASTSIIPAGLFRNRGFAACHVDVVRGRDVHTLIATKARGRPPVAEIIGDDALRQLRLSRDELEDAVASCPWSA